MNHLFKNQRTLSVFMAPGILLPMLSLYCIVALQACNESGASVQPPAASGEVDSLRMTIKSLLAIDDTVKKHLEIFDTLDYTVFSGQDWTRLHESHAKDIKVYWPDGHLTTGIDVHIEDLKKLFIHAPDTRIKEHPIRFGSGRYTAVSGVFEGTFTKPMPIGNGKFIQPTGKSFKMPMATLGIWEGGVMVEEHLFWDNQTYAKQMGLTN